MNDVELQKRIMNLIADDGYKSYKDVPDSIKMDLTVYSMQNALEPLSFMIESDDLCLVIKPLIKYMNNESPVYASDLAQLMKIIALNYYSYPLSEMFDRCLEYVEQDRMIDQGMQSHIDGTNGEVIWT